MNASDYISIGALVLVLAYSAFHQFIEYEKAKEAKQPDQLKPVIDKLSIVDQYAYPIATSVAVNPLIPKSDSLAAAVKIMQDKLKAAGITGVSDDTIKRYIEAAYQTYKQNGGKTNVAETPVSDDKLSAALDATQSALADNKGDENNG